MIDIKYLIVSNVLLGCAAVIYYIFLRRRTSFSSQRYWILSSMAIAIAVPMVPAPAQVGVFSPSINVLNEIIIMPNAETSTSGSNSIDYLLALPFIVGSLFFLGRFAAGLVQIYRISSRHHAIRIGRYKYFLLNENAQAFSFFNLIYLPESQIFGVVGLHEEQHARLFHSADNVFMGLASALFWLNPFFWLLFRDLRMNHEFEADQRVISNGTDSNFYQLTLLEAALGSFNRMPVSPLRQSTIKTRIKMMKMNPNLRASAFRLIPAIVFMSAAIWLASCGSDSSKNDSETDSSAVSKNDTVQGNSDVEDLPSEKENYSVVSKMPEFPGGQDAMTSFMIKNIKYPAEAKEAGIQGTVYIGFEVQPNGKLSNVHVQRPVHKALDAEALRVVKMMPDWNPGENNGETVPVQMTLPVSFKLS